MSCSPQLQQQVSSSGICDQEGYLPGDAHLLTPGTYEYMLPGECAFKAAAGIRFSNLVTLKYGLSRVSPV